MGPKYPILTPKEITKALEKGDFKFANQKGSHMKYVCNDKVVTAKFTLPKP